MKKSLILFSLMMLMLITFASGNHQNKTILNLSKAEFYESIHKSILVNNLDSDGRVKVGQHLLLVVKGVNVPVTVNSGEKRVSDLINRIDEMQLLAGTMMMQQDLNESSVSSSHDDSISQSMNSNEVKMPTEVKWSIFGLIILFFIFMIPYIRRLKQKIEKTK